MALFPASNRFVFVGVTCLAISGVACCLWLLWGGETQSSVASPGVSGPTPAKDNKATSKTTGKRSIAVCFADMAAGRKFDLPTRAQLEAYIEQEGRSAGSLIAGYMLATETVPWLEEAAERYPDDPRVSAMMLMVARGRNEPTGEWVRRMQENDPKNSLGWCSAALDTFKAGDVEGGLDALEDAASRGRPHMYPEELSRDITRACQSAGFEPLYAETLGAALLPMGQLHVLMELAREMKTDPEGEKGLAAESLLTLAGHLKQPAERGTLLEKYVASAMENIVASSIEWYEEMPGLNISAAEYQENYKAERAKISALVKENQRLLPTLSDTEMKQYLRRMAVEGELKAMQWVVQTKGAKQ